MSDIRIQYANMQLVVDGRLQQGILAQNARYMRRRCSLLWGNFVGFAKPKSLNLNICSSSIKLYNTHLKRRNWTTILCKSYYIKNFRNKEISLDTTGYHECYVFSLICNNRITQHVYVTLGCLLTLSQRFKLDE